MSAAFASMGRGLLSLMVRRTREPATYGPSAARESRPLPASAVARGTRAARYSGGETEISAERMAGGSTTRTRQGSVASSSVSKAYSNSTLSRVVTPAGRSEVMSTSRSKRAPSSGGAPAIVSALARRCWEARGIRCGAPASPLMMTRKTARTSVASASRVDRVSSARRGRAWPAGWATGAPASITRVRRSQTAPAQGARMRIEPVRAWLGARATVVTTGRPARTSTPSARRSRAGFIRRETGMPSPKRSTASRAAMPARDFVSSPSPERCASSMPEASTPERPWPSGERSMRRAISVSVGRNRITGSSPRTIAPARAERPMIQKVQRS